jgi:hypothetical protein
LLASPLNKKLGCCPAVLVALDDPAPAIAEGRSNIHGTATCLPAVEVVLVLPGEVAAVLEAPPAPAAPLNAMTAKSTRPEAGLMMASLMVPISPPEEPITCAPVN